MISFIHKISQYKFRYIIFFNSVLFLIVLLWGAIKYAFNWESTEDNFIDKYNIIWKISLGIIIAPLIETLLHQWLVYKILIRFTSNNFVIIIISAIFFGIAHCYSFGYVFVAFIIGIFLMLAFISWEGNGISRYMITVLIHMIHNSLMFFLSLLIK